MQFLLQFADQQVRPSAEGRRATKRASARQLTPNRQKHDMTNYVKAAGIAGILVVALATHCPRPTPTPLDNALREGQAAVTELDASTSAITYWVSESDGWHVVTTVDSVMGQRGEAEKHAIVRFSSLLLPDQSEFDLGSAAIGERQLAVCASAGSATRSR